MSLCPCGSSREYDACCAPFINGTPAPTAELLMRSRYTAYTMHNIDYIEKTSSPHAMKDFSRPDAQRYAEQSDWQGLEIMATEAGGEKDETGTVEFTFRYKYQGQDLSQHELSTFVRGKAGQWLYDDSKFNPRGEPVHVDKIGRNDPCPCGSQKKYKKCCGA